MLHTVFLGTCICIMLAMRINYHSLSHEAKATDSTCFELSCYLLLFVCLLLSSEEDIESMPSIFAGLLWGSMTRTGFPEEGHNLCLPCFCAQTLTSSHCSFALVACIFVKLEHDSLYALCMHLASQACSRDEEIESMPSIFV